MSKYIKTRWEALATGVSGDVDLERAWLRKAKEVYDIFCVKQKSYGPDNIAASGEVGVAIRMHDKIRRLLNISLDGVEDPLKDENLRDTVVDIADYGIIWLMCHDGDWPEYVDRDLSDRKAEEKSPKEDGHTSCLLWVAYTVAWVAAVGLIRWLSVSTKCI